MSSNFGGEGNNKKRGRKTRNLEEVFFPARAHVTTTVMRNQPVAAVAIRFCWTNKEEDETAKQYISAFTLEWLVEKTIQQLVNVCQRAVPAIRFDTITFK